MDVPIALWQARALLFSEQKRCRLHRASKNKNIAGRQHKRIATKARYFAAFLLIGFQRRKIDDTPLTVR
jgi:hypothetical protein